MFDLMIKGVSLTDEIGEFDVACKDGKIVEIAKSILGDSKETIDAEVEKERLRTSSYGAAPTSQPVRLAQGTLLCRHVHRLASRRDISDSAILDQ